jgi:DNA-binding winged helix-turn-helix (wHTH) protein
MRIAFEGCVLDLETREVLREGRPVSLSPKSFALLELMALGRPKAFSKAEIHAALWPDTFVSETNLANLVVELRSALGDDAHAPRVIRTVPRFGYAFCAEVTVGDRESSTASMEGFEHRLIWGRREVALVAGENLIGRDHDAVIWINDESVSRRHARIVVIANEARLEDLGSKNGTKLKGKPITRPTPLQDGDEFTLGDVALPLRFRRFGGAATTRTGTKKGRKDRAPD